MFIVTISTLPGLIYGASADSIVLGNLKEVEGYVDEILLNYATDRTNNGHNEILVEINKQRSKTKAELSFHNFEEKYVFSVSGMAFEIAAA